MELTEIEKKLLKIQALHSGALTDGEKKSAIMAKRRILKKMACISNGEYLQEYKFSLKNGRNVDVFMEILNRYEIDEYRFLNSSKPTVVAKVPGVFVDKILWPEYLATPERCGVWILIRNPVFKQGFIFIYLYKNIFLNYYHT